MGMIWLAKNDQTSHMFSGPNQLQVNAIDGVHTIDKNCLDVGSLILEVTTDHPIQKKTLLLQCTPTEDQNSSFSIWADACGIIKAQLRVGRSSRHLTVSGPVPEAHSKLRITYSWGVADQTMRLSIENLERGVLEQAEGNTPLPMPRSIIKALFSQTKTAQIAPVVTFLGTSDQIEPVGITPTIAEQSPIATPSGPQKIETLKVGDLVETVDHGPVPIRWICERTVPAIGLFQPLRLRAPYFGLTRDVLVAPEQRIAFENDEVEYLFGAESVLVEARHLMNRVSVLPEPANTQHIRLYQLLFDQHEIITVAGCQMESLFVGQIADKPGLVQSTLLKGLPPQNIPRHDALARPLLRSYEATTLHTIAMQ